MPANHRCTRCTTTSRRSSSAPAPSSRSRPALSGDVRALGAEISFGAPDKRAGTGCPRWEASARSGMAKIELPDARARVVARRGRRDQSRARRAVIDPRIKVVTGERRAGPNELIGVLEVRADGSCRAAVAERVEVDGRCHIRLAREAWQGKDALETRWWSVVLDGTGKAYTIRNGSCGDTVTTADVPRIVAALQSLRL